MTQVDLASAVSIDRSSLAKIETGQRRVSAVELAKIASALDTRIEWFLEDPLPAIISRRNMQQPGESSSIIDSTVERISGSVDFVIRHADRLDPVSVDKRDVPANTADADRLAADARALLKVDPQGPLTELAEKLAGIGLFAFSFALGAEAADAASILLARGGVAVVNGDLRVGRRRLALAHELGHFLARDEYSIDWRVLEYNEPDKREYLFDRFARALLLPEKSLRQEWAGHMSKDNYDDGLRIAAVKVASVYRVDMATLARRLIDLSLVDRQEAVRVRSFRTGRADIVELDLLVSDEFAPVGLPVEYQRAVLQLYRKEIVSAERAVELLFGAFDEESLPPLSRRSENEIWQFI